MRYGSEHKAETRARVVKSAAREIRLRGPEKVSVADVMGSAGLTHGGFYAHFASKEALIAEAIDVMFTDMQHRSPAFDGALASELADPRPALRTFLEAYISPEHRDRPERGCPLPALASDLARNSDTARVRFAAGLAKLTSRIEAVLIRIDNDDPSGEARAAVSQMVGAVALARAVGEGAQSDAILHDTLASLTKRLDI
ncbi:TetR/AcrR family transcriptional regulator [Sphingorhabdus pulchriflava]|uniref:TetR/AcrR family transcriptional regulator n=1 Tax=Sphingorhabdus pulchriflava TaxID=2292257 RepID=A0A371B1K9_9SPHN|nr:TetR/AcrR family transcriptional regulator [Sphingorhabdus pulchriflava]RDV01438.1 TetR/AcrR family transcriptional regulator [Sphingorhabdus pulchriflava]